jgi:hypothetical protein
MYAAIKATKTGEVVNRMALKFAIKTADKEG